jgi:DNA polymerase-1
MNTEKKRTAVIDGDMIVYRAGFSSEREIKWSDDIWTLQSSEKEMKIIINDLVDYILEQTEAVEYLMAFSSDKSFRYDIFPEYKANRKAKRKPLGIKDITNWAFKTHNGIRWDNLEADDVAGILCSNNPKMVAVSGDKDFGTLPCEWFNFLTATTSYTTEEEANYNHLCQAISGDTVDGFSGAKGIGSIGAKRFLDKHGATWQTVVDAYNSKGQTVTDALLNARLSYILRDSKEYNQKEGKIRLWKPQVQK